MNALEWGAATQAALGAYAGEFYLILTVLVVVGASRRETRDASIVLCVWYLLATLVTIPGEMNPLGVVWTMLLVIWLCIRQTYRHTHWLPVYLLVCATCRLVWSSVYGYYFDSPMVFKAVGNVFYLFALLGVPLSWMSLKASQRGSSGLSARYPGHW